MYEGVQLGYPAPPITLAPLLVVTNVPGYGNVDAHDKNNATSEGYKDGDQRLLVFHFGLQEDPNNFCPGQCQELNEYSHHKYSLSHSNCGDGGKQRHFHVLFETRSQKEPPKHD